MVQRERDRGGFRPPIPVSRIVDAGIPTVGRLLELIDKIRHPNNGAVDSNSPLIHDVMKAAKASNSDVVLLPGGQHTVVVVGRWIADHERLVKITAGTALTAAVVAGALGFVLRSHRREAPKK